MRDRGRDGAGRDLVSAALLAAVVLGACGPWLFTSRTLFYRDLGIAVRPILEEARRAPDGERDLLPAWSHHVGCGRPLLANPGNALMAPLALALSGLPFAAALELFVAGHLLLGGLGAMVLARRLGASPPATLVAAVGWALAGGYLVSATNLYPTLSAAAWAPLTWAAALAATERPSLGRLALLAASMAAQALGGQPEPLLLTIAGGAVLGLTRADGPLPRRLLRAATPWALAGPWALLLAAPQVLPAALHARESLRSFGFTTKGLLFNSLHPLRTPGLAWPIHGGHPLDRLEPGGFPAGELTDTGTPYLLSPYLGLSVLLLAALGVAARARAAAPGERSADAAPATAAPRSLRMALAGLALAGAVLALGRHLPGFTALVELVPAVLPFRYPVKFLFLPALAVPLLAALGTDALRRRAGPWPAAGAALVVALDLGLTHASFIPSIEPLEPVTPLAALLTGEAARDGLEPRQWRLHQHRLPQPWGPRLGPAVRTEQESYRAQRRLLVPATGASQGIRHAFDPSHDLLDPLATFRLSLALHRAPEPERWTGLGRAGILFVTSPRDDLEQSSDGVLVRLLPLGSDVGLGAGTGWLYRNRAFLPRARLTGRWRLGGGDAEEVVAEPRPSGGRPPPVLLETEPSPRPAATASGEAEIVLEAHDRLDVATGAEAPALLFVADALAGGWRALLDGEPVPLLRADHAFRAVAVPAGDHVVSFRYRAPGLLAGAGLAIAGAALLLVAGAGAVKRSRTVSRRAQVAAGAPRAAPPPTRRASRTKDDGLDPGPVVDDTPTGGGGGAPREPTEEQPR